MHLRMEGSLAAFACETKSALLSKPARHPGAGRDPATFVLTAASSKTLDPGLAPG